MSDGRFVRAERLRREVADGLDRFSFRAPMPIVWSAMIDDPGDPKAIEVRASLGTHERETNQPILVVSAQRIPLDAPDLEGSLASYVSSAAYLSAKAVWSHEFDEWLRFDGALVHDPHSPGNRP